MKGVYVCAGVCLVGVVCAVGPQTRKRELVTEELGGARGPVAAEPATPSGSKLASDVRGPSPQKVREAYARLPLSFEANEGQTDLQVDFFARGIGYSLFLSSTEAVLALGQRPPTFLRIQLIGATPAPKVEGIEELPAKSNYEGVRFSVGGEQRSDTFYATCL